MKEVRLGIIGVGGIACGTHIPQLKKVPQAKITAICDIDPAKLKKVGDELGIPETRRFADYRELAALGDIDAAEVCTPNCWHVPMALEVLRQGKSVNVEKPLACNWEEAKALENVRLRPGQTAMMCFSYRFMPAARYGKHMVESGILGEITGVDVVYFKDSGLWPGRKLEWRFDREQAGTGVLGDLGVHMLDMAQLLSGEAVRVCGVTKTIVKEREKTDGSVGKVTTDDVCMFMTQTREGVGATFNINRCALGHGGTVHFEVCGTKGGLRIDPFDPNGIYVTDGDVSPAHFRQLTVPEEFKAGQEESFIRAVLGEKCWLFPGLEEGLQNQRVLEALEISAREGRWADV